MKSTSEIGIIIVAKIKRGVIEISVMHRRRLKRQRTLDLILRAKGLNFKTAKSNWMPRKKKTMKWLPLILQSQRIQNKSLNRTRITHINPNTKQLKRKSRSTQLRSGIGAGENSIMGTTTAEMSTMTKMAKGRFIR